MDTAPAFHQVPYFQLPDNVPELLGGFEGRTGQGVFTMGDPEKKMTALYLPDRRTHLSFHPE